MTTNDLVAALGCKTMPLGTARPELTRVLATIERDGQRVILTKNGRFVGLLLPMRDLRTLYDAQEALR